MANIVTIQTSISGYNDKPCSLFSGYDLDLRILSVQVSTPLKVERRQGCVVIANQSNLDRDLMFKEDLLAAALQNYYAIKNGVATDGKSPRFVLSEKLGRADPALAVEKDDLDVSGQKYRINGSVSNLQMAVIATCWYANTKCETINNAIRQAQKMNSFWKASNGGIYTF